MAHTNQVFDEQFHLLHTGDPSLLAAAAALGMLVGADQVLLAALALLAIPVFPEELELLVLAAIAALGQTHHFPTAKQTKAVRISSVFGPH